ncbi:uncharacterized protein LOC122366283 [Amphibalanus amphitrite]|uniref:uncharacterized protein LOC122366283 n=1 Tax=Amphibalanus amphitrite TaxID=1232801 RepID=UPI001C9283A7|nr:uncharacterized protein LOC122366283 [Amphibalanus amphitrite]
MSSKLTSLLPRDKVLGRNLVTFDKYDESSDSLSLKSCPAFRPSWATKKTRSSYERKSRWASSSSLSDIREGQTLVSALKTQKEPPDKALGEDIKSLIENEWKRRIKDKPLDFAALQTLARKQRDKELNFQSKRSKTSCKAESDTTLHTHSSGMSKNERSISGLPKALHSSDVYGAGSQGVTKMRSTGDSASFSSKSCTVFSEKENEKSHRHSSPKRSARSIDNDISEFAHTTETPALGVQELKRRFSVRAKNLKSFEESAKKGDSKLTQTSFTDARMPDLHLAPASSPELQRENDIGLTETYQRSWNTRVTAIEITEVAGVLPQEKHAGATEIPREAKIASSDSVVANSASVSRDELSAKLTAYFQHHQRCPSMTEAISEHIIPPPPEFDYEFPFMHQPALDERQNEEPRDGHPPAKWQQQQTRAEDLDPDSTKHKQGRPVSAKKPSQGTRSRCTQTPASRRPGRRRSRRVTYSPSEASGPSDRSEDQWSTHSDRPRRRPRRGSGRRPAARDPPARSGGSRPVSGRSSQAAGSRPVSGRSQRAADRPTLLEEVHRKARDHKKVTAVKRRRSKRKVFQVPKNMPEAISRFLEQLSKDKEAIKVIHKMSLVSNKK